VVPELNNLELRLSEDRRSRQAPVIEHIVGAGALRGGLDRIGANDILWALTSHDLYRMLVRERAWAPDRYEHHVDAMAPYLELPRRHRRHRHARRVVRHQSRPSGQRRLPS
jgi:hypothetical protein